MNVAAITEEMIRYNARDLRRIAHALKVYAYAEAIGELEGLDAATLLILRLAAVLHDIGIHESERKYGSPTGIYQQIEGPPIAGEMLLKHGASQKVTDRVCYLIAHHHTYKEIDGIDYQILIEADFLVNIQEDDMSPFATRSAVEKYFKTPSGIRFANALYFA